MIKTIGKSYKIKSDNVEVVVDSFGAKVISIKIDGKEVLFYDENDISHSGIPLCFPSFGPLADNKFIYGDKEFPMNQHGFIRDNEFLIESENNKIICTFSSNEETKKRYPFEFKFIATYEIIENGLSTKFEFINLDEKALPLSPGIHPYFVVSDNNSITVTTTANEGYDNGDSYKKKSINELECFEVVDESGKYKTLKVKGLPDVHLIDKEIEKTVVNCGSHKVSVEYNSDDFNMLTVWRKVENAPYICVEPANKQNNLNNEPFWIEPNSSFITTVTYKLEK